MGRAVLAAFIPVGLTALYSVLMTPALDVQGVVDSVLPGNSTLSAGEAGVPVNYVVALFTLIATFIVSAGVGIWWLGRAWLVCAVVFYVIWASLYTTLFTNVAGIFTGSWQGMGYWIAQQDVARGNQPWYYYFVGLTVYELLPLVFGLAGIVYFFLRRDLIGSAMALWALLSLAAYVTATEKMPWLLVNITVPFVLVAAYFLGTLADRLDWRGMIKRGGELMPMALVALSPLIIAGSVYLLLQLLDPLRRFGLEHWLLMTSLIAAAILTAYLYRLSGPRRAAPAVALGVAALLLGLGITAAIRAAYTYDDSNVEVMVYAQGSFDLQTTFRSLEEDVYPLERRQGIGEGGLRYVVSVAVVLAGPYPRRSR